MCAWERERQRQRQTETDRDTQRERERWCALMVLCVCVCVWRVCSLFRCCIGLSLCDQWAQQTVPDIKSFKLNHTAVKFSLDLWHIIINYSLYPYAFDSPVHHHVRFHVCSWARHWWLFQLIYFYKLTENICSHSYRPVQRAPLSRNLEGVPYKCSFTLH